MPAGIIWDNDACIWFTAYNVCTQCSPATFVPQSGTLGHCCSVNTLVITIIAGQ